MGLTLISALMSSTTVLKVKCFLTLDGRTLTYYFPGHKRLHKLCTVSLIVSALRRHMVQELDTHMTTLKIINALVLIRK